MGQIILSKSSGKIRQGISKGAFLNTKPANKITDKNFTYIETRTTRVGEPMGLLLSLTYPTTVSFTGQRI